MTFRSPNWWQQLRWSAGAVAAVVQDVTGGTVLTLAWLNRDALIRTVTIGNAHFFSRGRHSIWNKGQSSGNSQFLRGILLDCDHDSLLLGIGDLADSCHTARTSCFFGSLKGDFSTILDHVKRTAASQDCSTSYLLRSVKRGTEKLVSKVGEEVAETVLSVGGTTAILTIKEASDLLFHLLAVLLALGIDPSTLVGELKGRMGRSGTSEKVRRSQDVQ